MEELATLVVPRDAASMDAARAIFREYAASLAIDLCFQGFEAELAALPGIVTKAHQNGVDDVRLVDASELTAREPHLAPALGAVRVPGEHIIDPWSAPLAYAHQALAHGAVIRRDSEVPRSLNQFTFTRHEFQQVHDAVLGILEHHRVHR